MACQPTNLNTPTRIWFHRHLAVITTIAVIDGQLLDVWLLSLSRWITYQHPNTYRRLPDVQAFSYYGQLIFDCLLTDLQQTAGRSCQHTQFTPHTRCLIGELLQWSLKGGYRSFCRHRVLDGVCFFFFFRRGSIPRQHFAEGNQR